MITNYLKMIVRSFWKNRTYGFINVIGLAVGMASALLIVMYIADEFSFDSRFSKIDRIYQVNMDVKMGENEGLTSGTPPPAGSAMKEEFPEVEDFTRVFHPYEVVVKNPASNDQFIERGVLAADDNFFSIFDYKMLAGNPLTCLSDPDAAVITRDMAVKYFKNEEAIGKILFFNGNPVRISGVLENIPAQSSIRFDILKPMKSLKVTEIFSWSWVWLQMETYVLLRPGLTENQVSALENKFPAMVAKRAVEAFDRIGQPFDAFLKKGGRWNFSLKPMDKVHLYSAGISGKLTNLGDIQQIRIFGLVAVFVIVLACINFMNLSTARATKRGKEVGIQKALGANRFRIMLQFLSESYLYTMAAGMIALLIIAVSLPYFNGLSGKELTFESVFSGANIVFLLTIMVVTGFLSGLYPAFYLTSFNPVSTLKSGMIKSSSGNRLIRNGLVVFQFSISIALIIGTLVVFRQLEFTRSKDMGFAKDNVLILPNVFDMTGKEAYREQLSRIPGVAEASLSTDVPAGDAFGDFFVPEPENSHIPVAKDLTLYSYMVDEYFVPALQLRVKSGRNFLQGKSDSATVILNEAAVKAIGWKNPVGQYLRYPGGNYTRFKVVGVVKDFDASSVREAITPFGLFHKSSQMNGSPKNYMLVKVQRGSEQSVLSSAEQQWKRFMPQVPFSYSFLDKNFEALYQVETQMSAVLNVFTFISILVACLGLFGLIAFSVEQRTREIGVRKVLGASVLNITSLISGDFIKLVLLAVLVASPVAWYLMNQWLQNFQYRISVEWWVFAVSGGGAVFIALLTIAYQAIKAALMNPVDSLKE